MCGELFVSSWLECVRFVPAREVCVCVCACVCACAVCVCVCACFPHTIQFVLASYIIEEGVCVCVCVCVCVHTIHVYMLCYIYATLRICYTNATYMYISVHSFPQLLLQLKNQVGVIPLQACLCSYKCFNTEGHTFYGVASTPGC